MFEGGDEGVGQQVAQDHREQEESGECGGEAG